MQQRNTPSAFGIHPFPLCAKGNKKLYVLFPFIHKGVPNLDGEAGYPANGGAFMCAQSVKSSLHHEKEIRGSDKSGYVCNRENPLIGGIGVQTIFTAILVLAMAFTLNGCG
jgi:hypothetical protein